MSIDFEREGLLDGLPDEKARSARRELLERLAEDGVPLEDLRQAVAENRLALLPAERALTGAPRHSVRDVAERTGVGVDLLLAQQQALGMPRPDPDERILNDEDLAAAERLRQFLDAGLPEEGMLQVARVLGQAMENVATSSRQLVGEALLHPGDSELELAGRYAAAAAELGPLMGSLLEHQYRVRLREGLRRDAISSETLKSGELVGATEIGVGFADLVGFTRLGERLPASDVGRLAGRLAEMAAAVAEPPVRLVKTIGDAAMLVSEETPPLLDALLDMVEAADQEGEDFPQLRAGAARGPALGRGGDWYGRPVNLASRVTDAARPGSVLVTRELRDHARAEEEADGGYRWSRAPARRFKGVKERVSLYRVRREREGDGAE
jgi:adenylate cyclase